VRDEHQVLIAVQKMIRAISGGMKQSPRNTALGPLGRSDIPILQVTRVKTVFQENGPVDEVRNVGLSILEVITHYSVLDLLDCLTDSRDFRCGQT